MIQNPSAFFASCARGLEAFLAEELAHMGLADVRAGRSGVYFSGSASDAMRACLWSRVASRVLQPLHQGEATDADQLYAAALAVDWTSIFTVEQSFAIDVAGSSPLIDNTQFAALRVKDAIADQFRAATGARPNVDVREAQIRVHVLLTPRQTIISLDWAGAPLHQRGYRSQTNIAPLRESLAAALLLRAGWPQLANEGAPLLDPMCGAGTLLLEAAQMARDIAPGLQRRFSFQNHRGMDNDAWAALRSEAQSRRDRGAGRTLHIYGSDNDPQVLKAARENAQRAGVADLIQFELADATRRGAPDTGKGLLICNPPYGERMAAETELVKLYSLFGDHCKRDFAGWKLAMLTTRDDLTPRLGLRAKRITPCYNGALECQFLEFEIPEAPHIDSAPDLANRLRKNLKQLQRWAQREQISCYRVYDADLPEYAIAVDRYESLGHVHLYVQEYVAPKTVDPVKAQKRLRAALATLLEFFEIPPARLHFRQRQRQRGDAQYQRQDRSNIHLQVIEQGRKLRVNLDDYLDTGLFLDHRPLRQLIQQQAKDARVLNLYCYTGAITVAAACGGARQTVSVDLSKNYLEWAEQNLRINGHKAEQSRRLPLPLRGHHLVRADCDSWLEQAAKDRSLRFELIVLDPPSFSTSKSMQNTLDLQRDHVGLISKAAALLAPNGTLYFSCNKRGFKLDHASLPELACEEITRKTLDPDFSRPRPPHKCWKLTRAGDSGLQELPKT